MGISDHGPANLFGVGIAHWRVLEKMHREIRELEDRLAHRLQRPIQVFLGVEANVIDLDGTLDVPEDVLAMLDYVMAGLHIPVRPGRWSHAWRFARANLAARAGSRAAGEEARRLNTEALINAVTRYRIDVVTHPGWRLPIDTPRLAAVCTARGTALEVNTSHEHGGVAYVRAAAETGVDFVVGSDAHEPERVGDLQAGLRVLQEAGVPVARIRNAVLHPADLDDARSPVKRRRPAVRAESAS